MINYLTDLDELREWVKTCEKLENNAVAIILCHTIAMSPMRSFATKIADVYYSRIAGSWVMGTGLIDDKIYIPASELEWFAWEPAPDKWGHYTAWRQQHELDTLNGLYAHDGNASGSWQLDLSPPLAEIKAALANWDGCIDD